jgi:hypothetical protein
MVNRTPDMPGLNPYTPWKTRGKIWMSLPVSARGQGDGMSAVHVEHGVNESEIGTRQRHQQLPEGQAPWS